MTILTTGANLPPAVVLGLSPTGLHVARALGRVGVPVVGVASSVQAGVASRYLHECLIEPDAARRLELLCRHFPVSADDNQKKPVLIPTSDQDIDWVIGNADRLSCHFTFQQSYRDGLAARIMTKESFYDLCGMHGVAYPRLWKGMLSEIAALRDKIAYPCMIKPSRIHEVKEKMAGKKGWIVRDAMEFDRTIPMIPDVAGVLLLQEIVPGAESAITLYCAYLDSKGGVRQPFTARKLRQYPPGFGSASQVQSHSEPDSREIAEHFLCAIGYQGIAAVEFKRDPVSGQLKIIEINVRPSLWFGITSAAGKHTVLAAYRDLAGLGELPAEYPQYEGVRWRYTLKDIWSAGFYRLKPDFLLPAPDLLAVGRSRSGVRAVFAVDDPIPAVAEIQNLLSKLVARFRKRLS